MRKLVWLPRLVLSSLALVLLWGVLEFALLEGRPVLAVPGLLALAAAFIDVHWIRASHPRLRRKRSVLRLRPLGIPVSMAVGTVLLYLVFEEAFSLVYVRLISVPDESPLDIYRYALEPFGWLPLLLATVVLAPLIEETAFRGWIQRPLERSWGAWPAIGFTALVFALAHGTIALIPYYFVAGIVFGFAVYATRSLWAGIWLHAAANASVLAWHLGGVDQAAYEAWAAKSGVLILSAVGLAITAALLVRRGKQVHAFSRRHPGRRFQVKERVA